MFRMDAPPWVRVHSESLTKATPLDKEAPPGGAKAVCDISAVMAAAAAAGGADPVAVARASADCLRSLEEEELKAREGAEATEVRGGRVPSLAGVALRRRALVASRGGHAAGPDAGCWCW